jgi:hypothetical protein
VDEARASTTASCVSAAPECQGVENDEINFHGAKMSGRGTRMLDGHQLRSPHSYMEAVIDASLMRQPAESIVMLESVPIDIGSAQRMV